MDEIVRAKRLQRLPAVLTRDEVRAVLRRLEGTPRLMAFLLYGAGAPAPVDRIVVIRTRSGRGDVLREFDALVGVSELKRSPLAFPTATRRTAFLSGASLAALAILLRAPKSCGVSPYNADSPEMFPFIAIYFFVTVILLVIGPQNLFPAGLKTRIALVYFPTDRAGWGSPIQLLGQNARVVFRLPQRS